MRACPHERACSSILQTSITTDRHNIFRTIFLNHVQTFCLQPPCPRKRSLRFARTSVGRMTSSFALLSGEPVWTVSQQPITGVCSPQRNVPCRLTHKNPVYIHPITLSVWFALSCILITYLEWWPQPGSPLWTWLKPAPIFAAWAVPVMFAVDW